MEIKIIILNIYIVKKIFINQFITDKMPLI
jgi:hypothetical protein